MTINDPFYDLTAEKIAERVYKNKSAFELKFKKKQSSELKYNSEKKFIEELNEDESKW